MGRIEEQTWLIGLAGILKESDTDKLMLNIGELAGICMRNGEHDAMSTLDGLMERRAEAELLSKRLRAGSSLSMGTLKKASKGEIV
ncbi:MAG: hypothetical protein K6E85_17020 [Lachnospiraceae bacterium]|nr:hypothetical protein [Lachnospiraceae bacterium]